jgi:D-methionine transport system ATP-binding protein
MAREMIRLENLSKVFHGAAGRIVALDSVDLSVREGDIFGIIGLSGAGKSTLVRCINYLERPTAGRVLFDGRELGAMSQAELFQTRQSIGMIFQDFNLMAQRNVLRNVRYPMEIANVPRKQARENALQLLGLVGLEDRLKAYPSQLSGGQKQRVAIARALATNPKVLLCDEATSALDPNTTRQILDLLLKINRELGVTIVVITHEMKIVQTICNRVAVIDDSRIVEEGDVRDVFANPKSRIARRLILPEGEVPIGEPGGMCLRIVFDGRSAYEPIISSMSIECRAVVNILYANSRMVEGQAIGQMLIQLPKDEAAAQRIRAWLTSRRIPHKEERQDAFDAVD